jgi:DNA (cytosine-5)-methyltransferase 1
MRELALFAGAGGGILGGLLHGWRTVAAVEIEDYPRRVLLQRQADGILPRFPIWDDVCTFDGKPWRGKVDVISGGFPCQDISAAGKGAGIEGERSGLWMEMARIIGEVRPPLVFVENSPLLISRGLTTVLSDLAKMGYDAEWCIVSASDCGAPHKRDRCWVIAYTKEKRIQGLRSQGEQKSDTHVKQEVSVRGCGGTTRKGDFLANTIEPQWNRGLHGVSWWEREPQETIQNIGKRGRQKDGFSDVDPELGRVANGVAHRVDRLKAIGNGQVPAVAAKAWQILTRGI